MNVLKDVAIGLAMVLLTTSGIWAQKKDDKELMKSGRPVLWEQANVAGRDLFLGPGGEEMKPDLSKVV